MGGDHSCTIWLVENSYTTVSSHSVRVSIFELRVIVVEEHNCLVRLSMRYYIDNHHLQRRYGCDYLNPNGGLLLSHKFTSTGPVSTL